MNGNSACRQAQLEEGNLYYELSRSDDDTFRVVERWTSIRTQFKCGPPSPHALLGQKRL